MKKLVVFLMVLGLFVGGSGIASASLLFDRGLPTDNLNNAAGSARSNVAWADGVTGIIDGDDFKLGGTGSYNVSSIRVWSTSSTGSLWFGAENGSFAHLGMVTGSQVAYPDTTPQYQKQSGAFANLYQLDFSINQVLNGATTYQFFLDGPVTGTSYAFLHASNAGLSGSTQQGADGLMLSASISGGTLSNVTAWTSLSTPTVNNGWDKVSDGNVQVFGTVPEPATMLLLGLGLMGVAGIRRKFKG